MGWHITERCRAGDLPMLLANGPLRLLPDRRLRPLRLHHPPFGGYPDRLLGLR